MANTSTERRQHQRTDVHLPVHLERMGGRELVGEAETFDLSGGGAGVRTTARFAVGDVVRLTISGDDVVVRHQGLVVGTRVSGGSNVVHIAFRSLDAPAADGLRRLLDVGGSGQAPAL